MGFKTNKSKENLFFNNEAIDSDDGEVFNLLTPKFSEVLISELPLGVKVQLCDKIIGSKDLISRFPNVIFEKIKKNKYTACCSVPIFPSELDAEGCVREYFEEVTSKYEKLLSNYIMSSKLINMSSNIYDDIAYFDFCIYIEDQTLINVENMISKIIDNLESAIYPPSLFISHASEDKPFVDKLVKELDKYNYNIWYDKHQILVGDCIVEKISVGLEKSDYLIIVLSKISIEKIWVKRELNSFLAKSLSIDKLNIFPVLIDDCQIPILLKSIHYADFRTSFVDGFLDLNIALKKKS